MKRFALCVTLTCMAWFAIFNSSAQGIEIDSTFSTFCEIYPFESIESISSLTIEGDISLNNDTSLVRVIVEDVSGFQYMVLEAYPLICEDLDFSVKDYCDETCALEQCKPISVIIQIIDAELKIDYLSYETDPKENPAESRYQAKRAKDEEKIDIMNERIPEFQMNWTSGDNSLVASYYDQKRKMFGDGYNLLGYDYYSDGVFEFLGHQDYPKVDPDLVRHFDWRERHGANDSLSPYWDGDTLGTGWLTYSKNQGISCNSCWTFSSLGTLEAIANLFTTDHIDYNLSEQDLLSCSRAGDCEGGDVDTALRYILYHDVVTEECFPYQAQDYTMLPCTTELKCSTPDSTLRMDGIKFYPYNSVYFKEDSLRVKLIEKGPLVFNFEVEPLKYHSVVLVGFYLQPDSTLYWVIKESKNPDWGENGFGKIMLESYISAYAVIPPIYQNGDTLPTTCIDKDGDGYYFWGIGDKPDTCDCLDIEDCNDNDSLVGGYDEKYNCTCLLEMDSLAHHVRTNVTWEDTIYVNYEVIIDSGACLTIRGYTAFAPEAMVLVKPGGKLILDSAYLTKACPELWDGIEVRGSDRSQFYDEYFGVVEVWDTSVIEFARCAIANHCKRCSPAINQSGGIIYAEKSIFRNNETDILLAPFHHIYQGNEVPYVSYFKKCRFTTTESFYPDYIPKSHIEMKGIFGLSIYGCIFENTCDTSLYPFLFRGKGISSIDCNFFLHKYCNAPNTNPCNDLDTCKFLKLDYGIKALNSISKLSFSIEECIFRNNLVGISLSGIDYVDIISNEFKCPKTVKHVDPQHFIGGLFMEGCSGYHVENNNFYAYDQGETGNPPSIGIGIKNSGPDHNEIYNNYFTKLHAGIYAIGENKGDSAGLCLKCNDMSQNINDFIVVEDENHQYGVMQGIYQYQGHPKDSTSVNAPAGNRFTGNFPSPLDTNNIKYFSYLNDAEAIFYIHHFSEDFQVKPIKNHYTEETVYLIERSSIEFVKDSACPSGLEGENNLKIFTSPYTLIAEADDQIAILKDQLFSSIDGGNTEELNFEIMISIPEDAFEIRQELLNESPFLSDTVMKQAIIKENVLPNAMIRDILTVNPQSAKSDKVLKALNTRYEPMPDYMMDQIMEGQKRLGSKELLEAQIQSWQQVRAKAKSSLFRQFLNDTNLVNQADSIINFLTNENEPNSKYYLALLYWNIGDTVEAFETLNALPGQFYLTNDQLLTHQQYQDYFNILKRMADSIWTASDLDSVAIQTLFELKDNGASGISACARGMLVKGGFLNYIETIPLIQLSNSVEYLVANKDGIKIESTKDYLKVFPNPAGKYTIAFYDIAPDHQSIILELINDLGMVIEIYYLDSGENQIVINLENIPNGFYFLNLYVDRNKIETEKLMIYKY